MGIGSIRIRACIPEAHVDASAVVGSGSILYPGVYVGPRASVGKNCILYPNAVVYDDCILGDRVTLHAGAVVGQDGFGYSTHKGTHHKIPQIGNVIIEDDVEIGASVAIQRATLGSTVIGRGTKIERFGGDRHAARIGSDALLVSLVGVAGSTKIGHHAIFGGQSGVVGHVNIGDHVTVAAQSGVINDVPDQSLMMGSPAMPAKQARRVLTLVGQLPELLARIRKLEQQVAELSISEEDSQSSK